MQAPLRFFVLRRKNDNEEFRIRQGIVDTGSQILVKTELVGIPEYFPEVFAAALFSVYNGNRKCLDAVLDPFCDILVRIGVSV